MIKLSFITVNIEQFRFGKYTSITCIHCGGTGEDPYNSEEYYDCGFCKGMKVIPLKKVEEDTRDIIDLTEKETDYKLIVPIIQIYKN